MVKIHAKQEVGQVVTGERENQNALFLHLNCLMPLFNETTTIINVHVDISMYMFLLMSHICKIIDDL